jgi:hypothetical protein
MEKALRPRSSRHAWIPNARSPTGQLALGEFGALAEINHDSF